MKHVNPRLLRGVAYVRADGDDPKKMLEALNKAFEQFKAEHTKEQDDIKKRLGDVVQSEKVDRINAAITDMQKAIEDSNAKLAALQVGGGSAGDKLTPEQREHKTAFDKYFRKGADAGLRELEVKAAMKTDSDPDGGYLVDVTTEQTVDRVLSTVSAIRGLAQVLQISNAGYKKMVNLGGTTSGWVGEREARPETNTPTLAALEYPAMELYANPAATQTMLDDGRFDISQWLADEVATEFAEEEGSAFYSGNGINKPRGIASYTMIADASYAWGKIGFAKTGVSNALSDSSNNGIDGILDLIYALKQGYRRNATFLMNRATQGAVRKLKDADKQYYWQPPIQAGQPAMLCGYPVADDDNVADVGSATFPIWFGDFRRGYLIVDRVGIRVLRDPYSNKPYVHFYTTKRVGGGIQNFEAIKALKCST